ncbi:MAG: hypothetical protein AB1679_21650 [Actinomycetota bacterium]
MKPDVITVLEDFFEVGFPWDEAALDELSERLVTLGDSPIAGLAEGFAGVRLRLENGEVPEPLRREIEAVVYPKLWKVLEAVRAGLPDGEQRARVQVLNRRLARLLAAEADIL